ncbi:MAG: Clp protease N-terminal domain-containing protein, partial [Candidatus Obscuribacterales bacterium]
MRLALGEAKRLRQNRIGVEQVLIGLIAEETSFAGQILKSHGVTLRDAKRIVEALSLPGVTVTSDHIPINSAVENLFA